MLRFCVRHCMCVCVCVCVCSQAAAAAAVEQRSAGEAAASLRREALEAERALGQWRRDALAEKADGNRRLAALEAQVEDRQVMTCADVVLGYTTLSFRWRGGGPEIVMVS